MMYLGNYRFRLSMALLGAALMIGGAATAAAQSLRAIAPAALEADRLELAREAPDLLLLRSGAFDPVSEYLDGARYGIETVVRGRYAIVQFRPGALDQGRRSLQARGIDILAYVPNNAYLVRLGSHSPEQLAAFDGARWAGLMQPVFRLAPALIDGSFKATAAPSGPVELDVYGYDGVRIADLALALGKLVPDAVVVDQADRAASPRLKIRLSAGALDLLAARLSEADDVAWIEPHYPIEIRNRDSVGPIQNNSGSCAAPVAGSCAGGLDLAFAPIWNKGLLGTGQIVAVADSGLDRNEDWFVGLDLGSGVVTAITDADAPAPVPPAIGLTYPDRKVYAYWVQPGATAYDSNAVCTTTPIGFHGTHVVGSVLGDRPPHSTPTVPNYANGEGMAPNAQVLFQDIGNDTSGCLSITDFGATLMQALAGGAGVHSNSWGASTAGVYSGNDAALDRVTWLLEDLLVNVAAGNQGPGPTTTGSPSNAKNAMTVGALAHGSQTTIASFSSRGPTADGRTKPDITAPGSSIVSAAGNTNNAGSIQIGTTSSKSGTSMATPTISGGAALMRQYFADGFYPRGSATAADTHEPSGALMKAVLLNGTRPELTWPTQNIGWGRMWLDNNLYFGGDARRMRYFQRENATGLATGESHEYTVTLAAGEELRATLVWFDPDASPGVGTTLINNLDLEVIGPTATVLRGSGRPIGFTGGFTTTLTAADSINPVEQVRVPIGPLPTDQPPGLYTLRVTGTSVPGNGRGGSDRQGYALVVSGSFGFPDPVLAAPAGVAVTGNGPGGIQIDFSTVGGAGGYQLYRAPGTCASADPGRFRMAAHGSAPPLVDLHSQGGYSYAYVVRAIGNDVEGMRSACVDVLSQAPCTLWPSFDTDSLVQSSNNASCQVALSWSPAQSNCPLPSTDITYDVLRDATPDFAAPTTIATGLTSPDHVDLSVVSGQAYYYRVVAVDDSGNESQPSRTVAATPAGAGGPDPFTFLDNVDDATYMTLESPWTFSSARASDGTYSYRNASGGTSATYLPNTCAAITMPPLRVPGNATLHYDARWNLETNWDGVVVQISANGGATWSDLPPTGGYPSNFSQTGNPPINACGFPASQGAYGGSSGGAFQPKNSSLAAFAGQTVLIRWVFSSDPGSEEEGFYLDRVRITSGELIFRDGFGDAPGACAVSP